MGAVAEQHGDFLQLQPDPYSTIFQDRQHPNFYLKERMQALYHPLLFGLMLSCALTELGLTVFMIAVGNENGTWPSPRYHSLLIFFCFDAAWTTLFSTTYMLWYFDGANHILANVTSSVIWLLITTILWGVGAGLIHTTREEGGCEGKLVSSRCRQSLTVEALGWTELGVCGCTLLLTLIWICVSSFAPPNVKEDTESNSSRLTV